ncbi:hypothetical protein Tco_0791229 [Tanacetum coccineum]
MVGDCCGHVVPIGIVEVECGGCGGVMCRGMVVLGVIGVGLGVGASLWFGLLGVFGLCFGLMLVRRFCRLGLCGVDDCGLVVVVGFGFYLGVLGGGYGGRLLLVWCYGFVMLVDVDVWVLVLAGYGMFVCSLMEDVVLCTVLSGISVWVVNWFRYCEIAAA